jgi:hypothetical protein
MHLRSNNKIERASFAARHMMGSKEHSAGKDCLGGKDRLGSRNIVDKGQFAMKEHFVSQDCLATRNTSVGTTKNTSLLSSMNASLLINNASTTSKLNFKDGRKLKRKAKVN